MFGPFNILAIIGTKMIQVNLFVMAGWAHQELLNERTEVAAVSDWKDLKCH